MLDQPLTGVKILAIEQYGAGPYGSMHLADLGAEVIKIEGPGGDTGRSTGPYMMGDKDSQFFQTFNLNKKTLALDLKDARGREVFERLVARSDAVINNLRGDLPSKLKVDYPHLSAIKPSIVCVHLSAYGRDNDRANWPGYDYLMQAEAGFMHLTGEPGTEPARFGLSIVDYMTGSMAALALCAALLRVARGGTGCDMDISLFDVALHQLSYPASWYLNSGHVTGRLERSAHPATVPCQLYRCADGWIFVMAMTVKFWQQLCTLVGREDLLSDERFADVAQRRQHRKMMTEVLDDVFGQQSVAHWVALLKSKVPVAPVYDLQQALDSPYVQDIGMIRPASHPVG
ncbi:MAG: CaiB/BaiF CoA transferase family protein, partial [Gammaproteobacteria bacterium]